jgi:hypothetical protein
MRKEVPMIRGIGLAALAVLALAASPSAAQDKVTHLGEATAERLCAECHAVRWSDRWRSRSNAPSFVAIAAVPGMSATALRVALQTSHRSMPNIVLPADERDDIVAYILSLRQPR